jgi:hypothetical protein
LSTRVLNLSPSSYLSSAVISLNMNDHITKEHAPKILRELFKLLQSFLEANPHNSYTPQMRMVMFAAQSMMNM